MIEIPRSLLRQFRLALKRSFPPRLRPEPQVPVIIEADKGKLTIHANHGDAGISLQLPAQHAPEVIALPAAALEEAQGREGIVTWERCGEKMVARFDDSGIPRVVESDAIDLAKLPPFPSPPTSFVTHPPIFLKSLGDAMSCTAKEGVRYATTKVQIRGTGEIVATDSRQLLVQSGFKFPWKDNVLIPRVGVFGAGVFPTDLPVKVGRTGTHVFFQTGPWTVALLADTQSRFPPYEHVIPKATRTTWTVGVADADVLLRTLPRLPGDKDSDAPVTVDLNGQVVVRAKAEEQQRPVELKLEHSKVSGSAVRFAVNRHWLLRALHLGFREIRIADPDTPLLCCEPDRKFIFMPLSKECVIPPSPDAMRITPTAVKSLRPTSPQRRKKIMPMPQPKTSGPAMPPRTNPNSPPVTVPMTDLVAEAEALQGLLREALGRISHLVVSLKQQRRQSRIVNTALSSLRHLQPPA